MSKDWQNFWTLIFLGVGYVLIVVSRILGIFNNRASDRQKNYAGITLLIFLIGVPAVFIYLGTVEEMWLTLTKPFAE